MGNEPSTASPKSTSSAVEKRPQEDTAKEPITIPTRPQLKDGDSSDELSRKRQHTDYVFFVCVKTKPWDSEKRKEAVFPDQEMQGNKVESAILDVEMEKKFASKEEREEKGIKTVEHATIESKNEKTMYAVKKYGQIEIQFEPKVPTRNAIYTFHVRHKGSELWKRQDARIEADDIVVKVKTDQFDIETVFITSKIAELTVEITSAGHVMKLDPTNEDMQIEFPPGSVSAPMAVTAEVTCVDASIIKRKVNQLLGDQHGILGVTDVVNVSHEKNFLFPVRLTLPMHPLQPTPKDEQPKLIVLYVEDGKVKELDTATIKEVKENLVEITTLHFCPVQAIRQTSSARSSEGKSVAKKVYGLGDQQCNILLFIQKLPDGIIRIRSEIVCEDKREEKEKNRGKHLGMQLIAPCTSPTIRLRKEERVRVTLAPSTGIKFLPDQGCTPFIPFNSVHDDNSYTFLARQNKEHGTGNLVKIVYTLDTATKRKTNKTLYEATFHTSEVMSMLNKNNPNVQVLVKKDTENLVDHTDKTQKRKQPAPKPEPRRTDTFSEVSMMRLSKQIPEGEYIHFAVGLRIPHVQATKMYRDTRDRNDAMLDLILFWMRQAVSDSAKRLKILTEALTEIDQTDLAERMMDAFNSKQEFR